MDEKLEKNIESVVMSIFAEKEEAAKVQRTQEALNESAETIENLTQSLEDKNAEFDKAAQDNETAMAEKDTKISEVTAELEAANAKIEELEESLASTKEALENIEKDQVAEARMTELKDEKVAILTDLETQTAKVREMSDEEFAAYKADRVELRNAVAAELEAAAEAAASQNDDEVPEGEEASTEEDEEEKASEEDEELTPPAEIGDGHALASAMNFTNIPSDSVRKKYEALGAAMAANLKGKSDK